MLPRWNSIVQNIKAFVQTLNDLVTHRFKRNKLGRKPKHSIRSYFKLIVAKEYKNASLRDAEHDYSKDICNTRVDHSVIHYWEKKFDKSILENIVKAIGSKIEELLGYLFSVIDSTRFTLWDKKEVEFHLLNRIADGTLYPISVFFGMVSPSNAIKGTIIEGSKDLYADAWYDDNEAMKVMFHQGYNTIVRPNTGRWRGYYRHKSRKLYNSLTGKQRYRNRGRGESPFGSLANEFGDRLKTSRIDASITRIGARIIAHMVKIYMRIEILLRIVRHAPRMKKL